MTSLAPTIKLSNGQHIPSIGLGTWRSRESDAERAVKDAIDIGYRHIDTAFVYENEDEVGRAVNAKIAEGKITRQDIFIVTKLAGIHHDPELVEYACRKSLTKKIWENDSSDMFTLSITAWNNTNPKICFEK